SRKRLLHSVAISADGARVAAATWDGTAQVWSIRSRKEPVTIGGNAAVRSEAFSPRSSLVVTAGDENSARVWNAATGTRVATLRGHEAPLNSARFSPNGRLVVTASDDGTVRVRQA